MGRTIIWCLIVGLIGVFVYYTFIKPKETFAELRQMAKDRHQRKLLAKQTINHQEWGIYGWSNNTYLSKVERFRQEEKIKNFWKKSN